MRKIDKELFKINYDDENKDYNEDDENYDAEYNDYDVEDEDYDGDDEYEIDNNSEIEEITEMLNNLRPYQFEPEVEESEESTDDDEIESSDEVSGARERIGNIDWCTCGSCYVENRDIDCLCCKEVPAISETQFDGNLCVTNAEEFKTLCLKASVLKNVLVALHETKGDALEKEVRNKSYRFAAYKQYVWWIYNGLGKGNRRVLPSCVLWKIRGVFPENDGRYSLYSEGQPD